MRIVTRLAIAIVVAVSLVSCSKSLIGVFASIEREVKIVEESRGLPEDLTVGSMALAGGRYFIATGLLRYRSSTDADVLNGDINEWVSVESPGDAGDNYQTTSVVAFDPGGGVQIYAAFTSTADETVTSGVYTIADPAAATVSLTAAGLDTTVETATAGVFVESVEELFVVTEGTGTYLVAVITKTAADTGDPEPYALYYTADGSTWNEVTGSESAYAYIDAASDGATAAAFLTPVSVYVDTDLTDGIDTSTSAVVRDGGAGTSFAGIYHQASAGRWWVADNSGFLYSSGDAATWTGNSDDDSDGDPDEYVVSSRDSTAIPFTDFVEINDTTAWRLLVGTNGYGYRILGASAADDPRLPDIYASNYEASALAADAIISWLYDPTFRTDYPVPIATGDGKEAYLTDLDENEDGQADPNLHDGYLVLAGTAGDGLWRALSYNESEGAIQWVKEAGTK